MPYISLVRVFPCAMVSKTPCMMASAKTERFIFLSIMTELRRPPVGLTIFWPAISKPLCLVP